MEYRKARQKDIKEMEKLILTEGKNQYNYLPEQGVKEHLEGIRKGNVEAMLAVDNGRMAGFASFIWGKIYPQHEQNLHGYIVETVVSEKFRGKGIGTKLLELAKQELAKKGCKTIFIKRHAENIASARMMEKAGFEEVETFYDPEIRDYGNRKTTVCKYKTI